MIEKKLMPGRIFIEYAWDSRLIEMIEDNNSSFAPVVLRELSEATSTLQQAAQKRHRQDPFMNGFRIPSPWVCIQLERYPALHCRHDQAVIWERNIVTLPVFDGRGHCSTI